MGLLKNFSLFLLLSLAGSQPVTQPVTGDPFAPIRLYNLTSPKDADGVYGAFQSQYDGEKKSETKAKMAFGLGILSYRRGEIIKAANYLGESINLKTRLDDYAHFYIGLIERDNKDLNGAKLHFTSVENHQPTSSREAEARMELARIAKIQGRWGEAYVLLARLERNHRHDPQYQDIVYSLLEAALETGHKIEQCKAAVKFYSKFAPYSLSKGWGFDLSKVKVGDHSIKCSVSARDQDRRMEQLILAGEFDEVQNEIKEWSANNSSENMTHVEMETGQLALAQGKSKEAIQHFTKVSEIQKNNLQVQMALSKAYAQDDDYPAAVESYLKASRMGPRFGRKSLAQKALFQAAFLSYQYRNYDGASRIFEDIAQHGRGQFVWDAKWHLAWIRYLKGDYEGADKEFLLLTHNKHYSVIDIEKLTYWRAMSIYRNGNLDSAKALFSDLASRSRLGFYTGAAIARLAAWPAPVPSPLPSALPLPQGSTHGAQERKPSGEESLSSGNETADKAVENLDDITVEEEGVTDNTPFELGPSVTSLKSPAMVERFERAKDFIDLGLNNWAISELREIERRTSNRSYLQDLMADYSRAGDYFRSATIADIVFENERVQEGLQKGLPFWSFAFPEAFAHPVVTYGKKFGVPAALVWAVMRGESGFREDIHSVAGAIGLMQLIVPTAKRLAQGMGLTDFNNQKLLTADTNILLGTRYLKRLDKVMEHNLPLVIASYNAGPHRVLGWLKDFGDLDMDEFIEHIPYVETRNYVKKVMRNYFVYETLYGKGQNILKCLAHKPTMKYDGPKPTSESWEGIN